MKIQIVKKGAPRDGGGQAVCPWFIDVPPPDNKKS
jgi:hypothetical protein